MFPDDWRRRNELLMRLRVEEDKSRADFVRFKKFARLIFTGS
jgi:hypothetical protein